MARKIEEPTVTPDPHDHGTRITHPAYGGIVAHRVSGHRNLYGSDFTHRHFMRVTITRSEHIRSLSHDWHHGEMTPLIEVDMTEAQWAEFISAPNIGTGVPCTIDNFNREQMPMLPDPARRQALFNQEIAETLRDSLQAIADLKTILATTPGISGKAQKALMSKIETAERELGPNMKFVEETFNRHIENTVSQAKQEIHGHMLRQITRAGADALDMPLALDVTTDQAEIEEQKMPVINVVPVQLEKIEGPKKGTLKIIKKPKEG